MSTYILAGVLSFLFVFLRSFQQQNVIHRRRALIIPVSLLMAFSEMFTAGLFIKTYLEESLSQALIMALFIGSSSGIGCLVSLPFHEWLTKRIYHWDTKKI